MQTSQPLSFKLILLETSEYVTTRNDNSLLLLFFFCPLPFLVQILAATQICSYFVYCILFLLICFQVLCFVCVSRIFLIIIVAFAVSLICCCCFFCPIFRVNFLWITPTIIMTHLMLRT